MTTKEVLERYYNETQNSYKERGLWHLLKANEKHITGLIEEDPTGYWFHKAYRQIDVTENPNTDLAIWHLLQDAPLFWKMLTDWDNDPWVGAEF